MNLINEYMIKRNKIELNEISLGYTTVYLYKVEELDEAQVGYSVDENGNILTGISDEDWKKEWLVIGYEDCCGDAIFTDMSNSEFPVFTAIHGVGKWNSQLISSTFDNFIKALGYIKEASRGRENPVKLEQNPLTENEKEKILSKIHHENKDIELLFWEDWLED
ncbi:hypothetical protein RBH29_16890 [Herbivorax sp. ANBcel31]|uniref:hypothetical protein n=1 Tax=Herbivorax sp. ANBcel31 TaxID=3069754 RepID=UPI0027B49D44|nr:hypothetical protein [Herbivorax sp. ANBcel31]MDQ2088105.1 hypothetical protein [Herbivorax sp. ANBcel31]